LDVLPYFNYANFNIERYDVLVHPRKTMNWACCSQLGRKLS